MHLRALIIFRLLQLKMLYKDVICNLEAYDVYKLAKIVYMDDDLVKLSNYIQNINEC